MNLKDIPKEELELMGYDDIALIVLQNAGKKMKLVDIFKKVCKALELPNNIVDDHLMEFFEQMSTNKKFVMLKNGYWDLQSRHKPEVFAMDDEGEDEIDVEEDYDEDEPVSEDVDDESDPDDDSEDDDLSDLMIIDDEEEE